MKEMVPYIERINVDGDFFYGFCERCKQERIHYVYFEQHNQTKKTVFYTSMCYKCWTSCCEYNLINSTLDLSPMHYPKETEVVTSVENWNKFVCFALVHSDDLPEDFDLIAKEILQYLKG